MPEKKKVQNLDEIKARKEALQQELKKLEAAVENDIDVIQSEMTDRMSPIWWVKKYPLRIVGTAVLIGFLAGGRSKNDNIAGTTIISAIIASLKVVAARKIVDEIVKLIDGDDNN
jgi:hypothetical protein